MTETPISFDSPVPTGRWPASDALLAEITAGLSAGSDLRGLLNRFLDPIVRLAGAQAGAVRILGSKGVDDDSERLQLAGHLGLPPAFCGAEQSVDRHCGFCGEAADARRLVWAADLRACSERHAALSADVGGRRMLVVPLQHRGRVLGVYNLFFDDDAEPGPDVSALLKSVGELLGLALDNARLEAENLRATVLHERQAMAAEVHDSVAQTMAFVKMRLPLLQDAMLAHDDPLSSRYLSDVRQAVGEVHASLREIVTHLRTRIDPRGLGPALETLATRFVERTGLRLEYLNRSPALTLGAERDAEVFHVAQEALANVERHANAARAWLHVEPVAAGFELSVEDDGVGAAPAMSSSEAGGHHGLQIMRERALRIGGTLTVSARPGGGTRVGLIVPSGGMAAC